MKTLALSIIVILMFGTLLVVSDLPTAHATCITLSNGIRTCNTGPPVSPHVTVETNQENYSTGDKIMILGHISNPDGKTPLVIKIFNPRNEMQFNKIFPPSLNQSYSWTVSTVAFWEFLNSGNYTVLTQYGQDHASTHFYLNSTLIQYLYSQSPLWQFKNGSPAQDVHCHAGLKLVIRAENSEPACVQQLTATKLILWGWALGPPPKVLYINKMSITGLQQNYTVGQPINATVTFSGYYLYTEPNVKILDANGTQVWFNCPFCYIRTEEIQSPSFETFTYHVREYSTNALPMINRTGIYTMTAYLDNKIAQANFTVINSGNNTLPASIMPCDTPYPPNNDGFPISGKGIPLLYMPRNSIGKICVNYYDILHSGGVQLKMYNMTSLSSDATEITISASQNTISDGSGNATVVYTIKTGNYSGLYGWNVFCVPLPFAVGYDNVSKITRADLTWNPEGTYFCPAGFYNFNVIGLSGIGFKMIP
ncbi:MAG: hypothetical protein ACREBI_07815 [Nitrosotalea sp.]